MRLLREKVRLGEDPPMGKGPPDPQGADGRLAAGLLCGLVGFWLGVAATVPAAGLAVASGGLGHGDYLMARLLYPYTMILWERSGGDLTGPLIALALAQLPAYGLALGAAYADKRARRPLGAAMILSHLAAVAYCPSFSK